MQDRQADAGVAIMSTLALEMGHYDRQIRRFLQYFPAESILVLQYERCKQGPVAMLSETFKFLELADAAASIPRGIYETPFNQSLSDRRYTLDATFREWLISEYADDVRSFGCRFANINLDLWPNFRQL